MIRKTICHKNSVKTHVLCNPTQFLFQLFLRTIQTSFNNAIFQKYCGVQGLQSSNVSIQVYECITSAAVAVVDCVFTVELRRRLFMLANLNCSCRTATQSPEAEKTRIIHSPRVSGLSELESIYKRGQPRSENYKWAFTSLTYSTL